MKSIWLRGPCAALILLAGCQSMKGLETPEAERAKALIKSNCIVTEYGEIHNPRRDGIRDDLMVMRIDQGTGGWIRVGFATEGFRDNFYYHESGSPVVCGARQWPGREAIGIKFDN